MNIDNLPVPKLEKKKKFKSRFSTKYGQREVTFKTVKHMDNLFTNNYLDNYFGQEKK